MGSIDKVINSIETGDDGTKYTLFMWVVVISVTLISLIISLCEIIIDIIDAIVDNISVGTGGVVTGIIDLVFIVILEPIQTALIIALILFIDRSSKINKIIRVVLLIVLGILSAVIALIGIFIPFFDTIEVATGGIIESLQTFIIYQAVQDPGSGNNLDYHGSDIVNYDENQDQD